MRIYHGSDHIVENPQYGLGKPYNDYGLCSTAPSPSTWPRNGEFSEAEMVMRTSMN